MSIGYFDAKINKAHSISIQEFDNTYHRLKTRIDAPRMVWDGEGWAIMNGFVRHFDGDEESVGVFEKMDRPDLKFKPEELSKGQKKAEEMSYWELKKFIGNIKHNGGDPDRWLVDLYL